MSPRLEPAATGEDVEIISTAGVHDSVSPHAGPRAPSGVTMSHRTEQERRQQLDSMDSEALRLLAASMPVIEQAKGVLMGCYGVDPTSAFALLNRVSSSKNLKLRDLAAVVVEAASTSSAPGSASPCAEVRRVLGSAHPGRPRAS